MKQTPIHPFKLLEESLPDNLMLDLIELQVAERAWFFALGDRTNAIFQYTRDHRITYTTPDKKTMPFTFELICEFVARILDNSRHGAASVYKYANLAGTFRNERTRKRYERLPISHWEYAAQFNPQDARLVLEYDLTISDQRGGRPQSLKKLQAHFEPEKYAQQAEAIARAPLPDLDEPGAEELLIDFIPGDDLPIDYSELRNLNGTWQIFHQQILRIVGQAKSKRIQPILQRIRADYEELIAEIKATGNIRE